ncbi:hypothetical protein DXU77_17865 [Pseudomonas lactis]|nr:hypothetical protein [Pseudomonas lactis]
MAAYRTTFPNLTHRHRGQALIPVGASLLAKNSQAPRLSRKDALPLTFFASKLAPTKGLRASPVSTSARFSRQNRYQVIKCRKAL